MAMQVKDIIEALEELDPQDEVGVDEGGLILIATDDRNWYCEIGGMPEGDDR